MSKLDRLVELQQSLQEQKADPNNKYKGNEKQLEFKLHVCVLCVIVMCVSNSLSLSLSLSLSHL